MADEGAPDLYVRLLAVKPPELTKNQWLVNAGVNRNFFSDLRKRGRARTDIVDKLLDAAGVSRAAFESGEAANPSYGDETGARSRPVKLPLLREPDEEPRDVPLLGTALGADFFVGEGGEHEFAEVTDLNLDEIVDHIRRPVSLRNKRNIYALSVVGASMSPRFDPGDPAYIDPTATPRIGDDVVVYLRRLEDDAERVFSVLIKRLVKRTAAFVQLEQFNPPMTFELPVDRVERVHRVIPWREIAVF